jgi:hypothetical protein
LGEKTDGESAKAGTKHEGPPVKKAKVEASPTRVSPRKHAPRRNLDLGLTRTNKKKVWRFYADPAWTS